MQWHEGSYSIPFKLFDKPKIWLEKLLWEDAKEKIDCGVFLPCWTTLSQDIFKWRFSEVKLNFIWGEMGII